VINKSCHTEIDSSLQTSLESSKAICERLMEQLICERLM